MQDIMYCLCICCFVLFLFIFVCVSLGFLLFSFVFCYCFLGGEVVFIFIVRFPHEMYTVISYSVTDVLSFKPKTELSYYSKIHVTHLQLPVCGCQTC